MDALSDRVEELANENFQFTPENINEYLINTVNDAVYEDEEYEDTTAYGALILKCADSEGFSKAFAYLLDYAGIADYTLIKIEDDIFGIKMTDGRIFCPYIEKILRRLNNITFDVWKKEHVK